MRICTVINWTAWYVVQPLYLSCSDVVLFSCIVIINALFSDNLAQQKVEESPQEKSDEKKEQAKDAVKNEVKEELAEQMAAEETETRVQWRIFFLFLLSNKIISLRFLSRDSWGYATHYLSPDR